jgi:hypothetical protein
MIPKKVIIIITLQILLEALLQFAELEPEPVPVRLIVIAVVLVPAVAAVMTPFPPNMPHRS